MRLNLHPYSIEVIEKPGSLPPRRREVLLRSVVRIAQDAFGKTTRETMERRVLPADEILVVRKGRRIIGYSLNRYFNLPTGRMLYLSGSAVEKQHEGKGLYGALRPLSILLACRDNRFSHIATRTQNPIIYASLAKLGLHPIEGRKVPKEISTAAIHLAAEISPGKAFDSASLVIKQAFRGSASVASPKHHDERFNTFVSTRINEAQGDALLQVGMLDRRKARVLFLTAADKISKKTAIDAQKLVERLTVVGKSAFDS